MKDGSACRLEQQKTNGVAILQPFIHWQGFHQTIKVCSRGEKNKKPEEKEESPH